MQGTGQIVKAAFLVFVASFSGVIGNNSTFIPTKSALAFTGSNKKYNENISTRNLVCTGETPFNSYFGSFTNNQYHVTLWNDAMDWLNKELNGSPQPPSVNAVPSSSYSISGPTSFCTSANYSITNLPAGATVTWSAIPSTAVTLTPSGQTVTVTKVTSATVYISAAITLSNCYAYAPSTLTVYVGSPASTSVSVFLKDVGSYYNLIFSTTPQPNVTYQWKINGVSQGANSSTCTVRAPTCSQSGYTALYAAQVTATNTCGSTASCEDFTFGCNPSPYVTDNGVCGGGGGGVQVMQQTSSTVNDVKFYPNPANTTLTLSSKSNAITLDNSTSTTPFSYELYNQRGKVLKNGYSPGSDVVLDISGLTNAMYILHIQINGKTLEKKVMVQH